MVYLLLTKQIVYSSCHKTWITHYEVLSFPVPGLWYLPFCAVSCTPVLLDWFFDCFVVIIILFVFDSKKIYSCDLVHLSLTDSGIGFGLCHIISCLRYHPSARNANASIHGIPIRSFSFNPSSLFALLLHCSGRS